MTVVSRKEVQARRRRVIAVSAPDEPVARKLVTGQLAKRERVDTLVQLTPGAGGFLGIGRKLPQWQAEVLSAAEVEISFKCRAKLVVRVGGRPKSWAELLSAIAASRDTALARQLDADFPYQCAFVRTVQKTGEPGYFGKIPFSTVNERAIAVAKHYVDNTSVPGVSGKLCSPMDPDRYVVVSDGRVGKASSMETLVSDSLIMSAASCLGRHNISQFDPAAVGVAAVTAIMHYAEIPVVRYCFSLAYLSRVRENHAIDLNQVLVTVYKGVESLLLEIYDELPEGGVITDTHVEQKALTILAAA
jgi:hypothetical protein